MTTETRTEVVEYTGRDLRPELTPMPDGIAALPRHRGYPVPWFVAWQGGVPEFRAMDPEKFQAAVTENRCWVCGGQMRLYKTFVAGPMCGITRTSAEPPGHLECARWSARNCPFLSRPHMVRREGGGIEDLEKNVPGLMIRRNPGVSLLWTTFGFDMFKEGPGYLLKMGEPESVEWWSQGRKATRVEVLHSIDTGYPALEKVAAEEGPDALAELKSMRDRFEGRFLPRE